MYPRHQDQCCYSTLEPTLADIAQRRMRPHCTYRKPNYHRRKSLVNRYVDKCRYCHFVFMAVSVVLIVFLVAFAIHVLRKQTDPGEDEWCAKSAGEDFPPTTKDTHLCSVGFPHYDESATGFAINRLVHPNRTFVISHDFRTFADYTLMFSTTQLTNFTIYGRKGKCPTALKYEIMKVFDSSGIGTMFNRSASSAVVKMRFARKFSTGIWYFSITNTGNRSANFELDFSQHHKTPSRLESSPLICLNGVYDRGVCNCDHGFNGRFCEIDGCKNHCSEGNGVCVFGNETGLHECVCKSGRRGRFCEYSMETKCQNGIDDDHDGLVDCDDPDCCDHDECTNREFCVILPPESVFASTEPTSSIFSRYKRLLIDLYATQRLVETDGVFEPRTSSLLVGTVKDARGLSASGVKVQIMNDPRYGYTYTNQDGFFAMLVNGGISLVIWFEDRHTQRRTEAITWIPWNTIHRLETVHLGDSPDLLVEMTDHPNIELVVENPHSNFASVDQHFDISPDNKTFRFNVPMCDSGLVLFYTAHLSNPNEFGLKVLLTSKFIPNGLTLVHLKVRAEGRIKEATFNAESDLSYSFQWPYADIMGSTLMSSFPLCASAGYQYRDSPKIQWTTKCTQIQSPLLRRPTHNWTLNVVHSIDTRSGILSYGNGRLVDVSRDLSIVRLRQNKRHSSQVSPPFAAQIVLPLANGDLIALTDRAVDILRAADGFRRREIVKFESVSIRRKIAVDPVFGYAYVYDSDMDGIVRIRSINDAVPYPEDNLEIAFDLNHVMDNAVNLSLPQAGIKDWLFDNKGSLYFLISDHLMYMDTKSGHSRVLCTFSKRRSTHGRMTRCSVHVPCDSIFSGSISSLSVDRYTNQVYLVSEQCVFKVCETEENGKARMQPIYGVCRRFCVGRRHHIDLKGMTSVVFSQMHAFVLAELGHRLYQIDKHSNRIGEIPAVCNQSVSITSAEPCNGRIIDRINLYSSGSLLLSDRNGQLLQFAFDTVETDLEINSNFEIATADEKFRFDPAGVHLATYHLRSGGYSLIRNISTNTHNTISIFQSDLKITDAQSDTRIKFDYKRQKCRINHSPTRTPGCVFSALFDQNSNINILSGDGNRYEMVYDNSNLLEKIRISDATHHATLNVPLTS